MEGNAYYSKQTNNVARFALDLVNDMSRVPKFFLPVESLSTSIIPKSTNATESSSRSSSFPTTIRSPSAFTDCPEEEESTIFLTEAERDIFNRIYFIDPEALTPFGPLDPTRDPSTGHYKWRERSRNTSLPAVHVRAIHPSILEN
jgi:hypothetical protein